MADEPETNTETQPLPENASVEDAVAMLDELPEDEETQPRREGDNAQTEGGDTEQEAGETEEGEQEPVEANGAPEFWSAEDKAAWGKVPPELRPVLEKYEHQRVAFANQKAEEAAKVRQEAQAEVKQLTNTVDEAAKWWAQAGPALFQAFQGKYARVDWNKLSQENPAEWARLRQEAESECALLAEAQRRGQADIQAAQQREEGRVQQAKHDAWTKMATTLPDHYGTPEKSAATTRQLGDYLIAQGIPADRINGIHEAPILAIATKAMLYDAAKAKASTVMTQQRDQETGKFTAQQTPKRVQPGPGRTGSQASDAARQVGERFRKSGGADINDAAELIRLNGL